MRKPQTRVIPKAAGRPRAAIQERIAGRVPGTPASPFRLSEVRYAYPRPGSPVHRDTALLSRKQPCFALDNPAPPRIRLHRRKQGCFAVDSPVPPQTTLRRRRTGGALPQTAVRRRKQPCFFTNNVASPWICLFCRKQPCIAANNLPSPWITLRRLQEPYVVLHELSSLSSTSGCFHLPEPLGARRPHYICCRWARFQDKPTRTNFMPTQRG